MPVSSGKQWSLVGLLTAIVVLIIAAAVIIPVIEQRRARRALERSPWGQNMESLRVVCQGMFTFSESNNGYFPGLDNAGYITDATVEYRYQRLLEGNYVGSDHLISRHEIKSDWNPAAGPFKTAWAAGPVTSDNYSYAMLKIDGQPGEKSITGRGQAWRLTKTVNPLSVLLSDRNIGPNDRNAVMSPSSVTSKDYSGAVAWGDGHVTTEASYRLTTRYGAEGKINHKDNLFEAEGTDDAYMIYTGN